MTRKKMPLFEKTKKYGEKIENSKSLLKVWIERIVTGTEN